MAADDEEEEEPDEEESIEAPRPWWVHMLPQWVVDFLDRIENIQRSVAYLVTLVQPSCSRRTVTAPPHAGSCVHHSARGGGCVGGGS